MGWWGYRHRDAPQQVLDVWRQRELPAGPALVLVFVPGGGWVHGSRMLQGYALLSHFAAQGWVCLAIDYRVSPHHRWRRHVNDIKAAVAWARANVDRFGGDQNFIAIAGCSAGGHLAALTGLTADDAGFHGELTPDADTSVDAVVSIYGRYDWEDRSTPERARFMDYLEYVVVRKRYDRDPEVYRAASPITRVRSDASPFLVVHGSADTLIPGGARARIRRAAAGHVAVERRVPGVAWCPPQLRHDRRRAYCAGRHSDRRVPQRDASNPCAQQGTSGYLDAPAGPGSTATRSR